MMIMATWISGLSRYLPHELAPAQKITYVPDIVVSGLSSYSHPDPAKIQITWIV